jgi:hypothetical protein
MTDLAFGPAYDLVRRIDLRGTKDCAWLVVVTPVQPQPELLSDFIQEAAVWWNTPVRVIDAAGMAIAELHESLHQPPDDGVIIQGLDHWSDQYLRALDINRSDLQRPGFVILWLTPDGLQHLFRRAPNLKSWIGGSSFQAIPDPGLMSEQEKRNRLAELSAHYNLTSEEVLEKATRGILPSDPEFAEWLILLGRGELVR